MQTFPFISNVKFCACAKFFVKPQYRVLMQPGRYHVTLINGSIAHMVHLCFSEELEQISTRHEFHDDVNWIIVHTHSKHLHDVGVVKVPAGGGGGRRKDGENEGE